MKKYLVVTVVALLLLSMASVAMAAPEVTSWMGGRYYSYFTTIDGDKGFNPSPGTDCWDAILYAKVTEKNTWAGIKYIADTWNQHIFYDFGINNIAGTPWSLGFDTHDTGTANLGQQFMGDLFNDFKADPLFNTCDMGGSINVKYITDSFELRAETHVQQEDGYIPDPDRPYDERKFLDANGTIPNPDYNPRDKMNNANALALIFKNELGKFYIGAKAKDVADKMSKPVYIVGTDLKLNDDLGLKADVWVDKDGIAKNGEFAAPFWGNAGHTTFQLTLTYDKVTGQLMYSQPEASGYEDAIGIGGAYQFTDKFLAGVKYMACEATDGETGFYDVYGMYKVGAWDLKGGISNARFPNGNTEGPNSGNTNAYSQSDQAKLLDDPFFYIGVHFEF